MFSMHTIWYKNNINYVYKLMLYIIVIMYKVLIYASFINFINPLIHAWLIKVI